MSRHCTPLETEAALKFCVVIHSMSLSCPVRGPVDFCANKVFTWGSGVQDGSQGSKGLFTQCQLNLLHSHFLCFASTTCSTRIGL